MSAMPKPQSTDAPMLSVENVSITLAGKSDDSFKLLRDVTMQLSQSSIHALVGESGSGKTLLARSIIRLLPPGIAIAGGAIKFRGTDLARLSERDMQRVRGREIGYIFQEPMLSLNPAIKVGEQMAEGMRHHLRMSGGAIRERSIEMLERVSIRDPKGALERYPHEFSGGMRQRIMLASVLSLDPALLIADEATTALDAIIQRDVLDIMTELTRDLGTSVLMITHDLGLVAQYADNVTVLNNGSLVESGHADAVIRRPRETYTQKLLSASPSRQRRPARNPDAPQVLNINDLHIRYKGTAFLPWRQPAEVHAVQGVSLDVHRSETVAVVGESGSGKSTVGRAVVGLKGASEGDVDVAGHIVNVGDRNALRQLRRHAQIVFQDPASSLDPRYRVGALVEEGLTLSGKRPAAERQELVRQALTDVQLDPEMSGRYPHQLSGGQRQRVAIARAIISEPDLVVADEAVSALDVTVQAQVLDLMSRLQREKGFAYLFISHDLGVVEQIADRVVVMRSGRIVEVAQRDELFDRPIHPYTRRLLAASAEVRQHEDGGFTVARRVLPELGEHTAQLACYESGQDYFLSEVLQDHFVALQRPVLAPGQDGEPGAEEVEPMADGVPAT